MYVTSSSTFLNFPCSSQTFCSTFATFSSRTFSVNSILFFKSFVSSRNFPISCFVITRLFSIIFDIYWWCFANSSSKTVFISSTILSLSCAVFPLAFQTAPENNNQTRGSFLKLKCSFRKTKACQMALSYIGPNIWTKIPDTLKRTKNLNTFKHNLKEHYLKELKISNFR